MARQAVGFGRVRVQPPTPAYTGPDDRLYIVAARYNGSGPTQVVIRGRQLSPLGDLNEFERVLEFQGTSYEQLTETVTIGEGFLHSVTAGRNTDESMMRGALWVACSLGRPTQGERRAWRALFADYLGPNATVGWPEGRLLSPIDGRGDHRLISTATPLAGGEWEITVPNAWWRLVAFNIFFQADATVATRRLKLEALDPLSVQPGWRSGITSGVAASKSARLSLYHAAGYGQIGADDFTGPLPHNAIVGPSWTLRTVTENLQAGDQYQGAVLFVEEWLNPGSLAL